MWINDQSEIWNRRTGYLFKVGVREETEDEESRDDVTEWRYSSSSVRERHPGRLRPNVTRSRTENFH